MEINQLLLKNSFAVNELLRQHNIIAPDLQTGIRKAYQKDGEKFMIKLVNRLTGQSAVSGFDTGTDMGPEAPAGSYVNSDGVTIVPGSAEETGKFWEVWANVLKYAGATGQTFEAFKKNITGSSSEDEQIKYEGSNSTTLYIIAGIVAAIIILILIFKK